jgi:uncharacterized protein
MRIIITGGSGFIGSRLSDDLIKSGHEVIILSRSPSNTRQRFPNGIKVERWDGNTAQNWGNLVNRNSAIINLAGENLSTGQWTTIRKKRIIESRVNAGKAIVDAIQLAKEKPRVLIQASAVGYYGVHQDELIKESQSAGDDYLGVVCTKWEASTSEVEEYGIRRVILRTGLVLDAKQGALPRLALPFKFFVGGKIGSGKQYIPWIHIQDEIRAIKFLLEEEATSGAFNLSTPNPVTNAEFAKTLGRVMKRPSIFPVPSIAIKILFGEMSIVILEGQRAIPDRLQEAGFEFNFPILEDALKNILR